MNYINYVNHTLFTPDTYHRRYDEDLPDFLKLGKRVGLVALPFISLYRPCGAVLSLAMNISRGFTHLTQALMREQKGEWVNAGIEILKTALAIVSIAVAVLSSAFCLFITTGADCAQGIFATAQHLYRKENYKAGEEILQVCASSSYLAFMVTGVLEVILLSTLIQAALCLYQSRGELKQGRYIEALGKVVFSGIRFGQANQYRGLIERRNALLALKRCQAVFARASRGREVRHLIEHPLNSLDKVDEQRVILQNQEGKYDFGAHIHGLGKGVVKGSNLAFKQIVYEGKEMTELEFKVNHAFRKHLEEAFKELNGIDRKDLQDILRLSGSHVENIVFDRTTGGESSVHTIVLGGLGTISMGSDPDVTGLYDKVIVRIDSNKTIYDLHEMLAFADLDTALCFSNREDQERLKMGHLFRTFFPRTASPFERTEEFFDLSIEALKEIMIEKEPEMKGIFDDYLDRMIAEEILPGRMRYRIIGLADKVRALGGRALTAAVTGAYNNDEDLYARVASTLSMGMISTELKDNYMSGEYEGLGSHYWLGSADSVFTQMITEKNIQDNTPLDTYYFGKARLMISLDALEMGTYQYYTDSFGHRKLQPMWLWGNYGDRSNILEFTKQIQKENSTDWNWPYDGHEIMLKERIRPSFFTGVILRDEATRKGLLEYLRKHEIVTKDILGIETIFGIRVENFLRVGQYATKDLLAM